MTEPKEMTPEELLADWRSHGDTAHALWVSTILEESLATLLQLDMPNLSNRLKGKFFSGNGAFTSFATKIDVAYARDLISASIRRDLHAIREVRNNFAHPKKVIDFRAPEVVALMRKFSDYRTGRSGSDLIFYMDKVLACLKAIEPKIETFRLIKAIQRHGSPAARLPSPGKS
jgi:hypothetical protein